jgi:glycosyltransferase involved in cell wall biosynthesis
MQVLTHISVAHEALSKFKTTRRLLPAPLLQVLGRAWLKAAVLRLELSRPDDISVVIGLRNRADYRLVNALKSIRMQTYPADLVRILVVDYGSEAESAQRAERICGEHRADYLRVDDVPVWSRSRCLNVGIRRAETKFVMTSDVDIVFSPRYLSDSVGVLTTSPLSVVCSAMLDLPEESAEILERGARIGEVLQPDAWKEWCCPRYDWKEHPSICMTYTALYQVIRGYDEHYESWGWEDDDLMQRFTYLGLRRKVLDAGSFYMHQWHANSERSTDAEQTRRNESYFKSNHSILRNDDGWGVPPVVWSDLRLVRPENAGPIV